MPRCIHIRDHHCAVSLTPFVLACVLQLDKFYPVQQLHRSSDMDRHVTHHAFNCRVSADWSLKGPGSSDHMSLVAKQHSRYCMAEASPRGITAMCMQCQAQPQDKTAGTQTSCPKQENVRLLADCTIMGNQQGQRNSRLANAQTALQPCKGLAVAHHTHDPRAHVKHACLQCLEGSACKANHPSRTVQSQVGITPPLSAEHRADQLESIICFDKCWTILICVHCLCISRQIMQYALTCVSIVCVTPKQSTAFSANMMDYT